MAKRRSRSGSKANGDASEGDGLPMADIRHPGAKRRNIPPAKIAAEGAVPIIPKVEYAYNPHLPPVLRWHGLPARESHGQDAHATPDLYPELIQTAGQRPLTPDEQKLLANALQNHQPWLEWTGKREKPGFAVDPVALHIHERISAQAILKVAARQDVNRFLFADPQQEYHEAVQFYRHDIDWSNRLILGDSLQVMSSLARREDLAGKVQMIYMDPPYGIKFASNFQPEVGKRDVKDKQEDLTREPEMVRAYRDTWHLGIHSYLSYLRDRLIAARELLADTGSIFVQIGDENLHRVQSILDEVFTPKNWRATITVRKTLPLGADGMTGVTDFLLWYTRNPEKAKKRERTLWREKTVGSDSPYKFVQEASGNVRPLFEAENAALDRDEIVPGLLRVDKLESSGYTPSCFYNFEHDGIEIQAQSKSWRTNQIGMTRVIAAGRVIRAQSSVRPSYRLFASDSPGMALPNLWADLQGAKNPQYVVQTNEEVVKRCLLMTTDPGDLVLDPTCGSGTTAYVAEQWGRRWITIDTSRVAVAIARQRLLTAKFDAYRTKDKSGTGVPPVNQNHGRDAHATFSDPSSGFIYKTVPHIKLGKIAQNVALDPIFAKHEPILDAALKKANAELAKVGKELRTKLEMKLAKKQKDEGKRAITDADKRRWLLPPDNRAKGIKYTVDAGAGEWYHWEVPFDADPDWPTGLQDAVKAYRAAWRAKMDEVNACINASAEQEELVDQPEIVRGVTRVSGPFTVEAVQPPEMTLGEPMESGTGFQPVAEEYDSGHGQDARATFTIRPVEPTNELEVANVGAYLDQMFRYIKADGVRFLNNRQMKWTRLEPLFESGNASGFHAEGRWVEATSPSPQTGQAAGTPLPHDDGRANVAVLFGPQYGPVTGPVVVEALRQGHIRGYEHVVIAGFNFDGAAQTAFDNQAHPKVKIHLAHIRPDINPGMNGLLKESPQPGGGQLFTVFGQPRITVRESEREPGMLEVEMQGVDIYNPATDEVVSTGAGKVAAWFLDGDYDGRTFCVTQAFFPDRSAWEKLQRALNGKDGPIDAERFEAFSGTVSLPFPKGKHGCVAVKVIDPRGNEVMAVERV